MYERLIKEAEDDDVKVSEVVLPKRIKGLYCNSHIAINKCLETTTEKTCVMSEELGHHYKTNGDILDQTKLSNRKQERLARAWGYEKLVTVEDLISAYIEGIQNRYELAEYLRVTEEFIDECLKYYKEKYGLCYQIGSYIVYFEPLGIFQKF